MELLIFLILGTSKREQRAKKKNKFVKLWRIKLTLIWTLKAFQKK